MIRGELFELECLEYLQNKYRYENVHFHHNGGMDSTMSDISVIKNGKVAFLLRLKIIRLNPGNSLYILMLILTALDFLQKITAYKIQ